MLAAIAALWTMPATAVSYNFFAGYRGEYTNNVRLAAQMTEDEAVHALRAGLAARSETRELDMTAIGYADFRNYYRDTFEDQTRVAVDASARWRPARQLAWTVEEYYGQTLVDVTQPNTPGNTQDVNVFAFGPNVYFFPSPRDTVEVGARYGNYYLERDESDAHRYVAVARWRRGWSPITDASLNFEMLKVDRYEAGADYDRVHSFVELERRRPRGHYRAAFGATSARGEFEEDEPFVRAEWLYRLTTETHMSLSLGTRLSDYAEDVFATGTLPESGTTGTYRLEYAQWQYLAQRGRAGDRASVYAETREFIVGGEERREGAAFELGLGLSERLSGALLGGYVAIRYAGLSAEDRDSTGGARLSYRLTRHMMGSIEARYSARASTDSARDYDERRGAISLSYDTNPALAGRVGR